MAQTRDNPQLRTKSHDRYAFLVGNGLTLYAGAIVALATARNATAGLPGYARPYTGAMGELYLGIEDDPTVLGDTASTGFTTFPTQQRAGVSLNGMIRLDVPVAGTLAGDATDVSKLVYATADNAFSITRPTRGQPVGIILFPSSATVAGAVRFFSFGEALAMQGAGLRQLVNLGSYDADTLTTANIRTSLVMGFAGRFVSMFAAIDIAPTGAGGTATINLEIDGTNVTGGVVTVATGDAKATVKQGATAITVGEFNEASLIDVECVLGTDMTAGRFDLFAIVERAIGT